MYPRSNRVTRFSTEIGLFALLAALLVAACAHARPVSDKEATRAASAWLTRNPRPLDMPMGRTVERAQRFDSKNGSALYYVVHLRPSGFVIVSSDDRIEPIIAFSDHGTYDSSPDSPLANLLSRDMTARRALALTKPPRRSITKDAMAGVAAVEYEALANAARAKWQRLCGVSTQSVGIMGLSSVSDVRVSPLLTTRWSQTYVCSPAVACYNYYVPPYAEGAYNNYPCGCVATAMAQVMRFHQVPAAGIGVNTYTIKVDSTYRSASTRGGDGLGGPYDWASMTTTYGCSSTLEQRQAVGALCYDAGVSIQMEYSPSGSGISADEFGRVADRLIDTFGYSNAKKGWRNGYNIGTNLNKMINPNLHARLPVLLGVNSSTSGHYIVCDGYGYNSSTLYHHLNMGWSGTSDAWYNLPTIDAYYSYDTVHSCTYNIYTSGTGEIISGRVIDSQGHPIAGAQVTATWASSTYGPATTSSTGVYAIANVPSNRTFTVAVTHPLYTFTSRSASTTTSSDMNYTCGNVINIDFTGSGGPAVTSFAINNGASQTSSATVSLNNTCAGSPTQYMASESASFSGATWKTYSTAPSFTLSAGDEVKTVYFKVKNSVGTESSSVSDTITANVTTPVTTASPVGGVYNQAKNVTLSCSEQATIYYTTDGTEPTTASPVYSLPIAITSDTTLRFYAVDEFGSQENPKQQERYWILSGDGSISSAKASADGTVVRLGNKALYFKTGAFGYIEELSRVCGIRLSGSIPANEGDLVCLVGSMITTMGERAVLLEAITSSGSASVRPFAVNNTSLLSDVLCGIHVTTWGVVQPGSITANSYVISDGSPGPGIRVITLATPAVNEGEFVTVTGAAGFDGYRIIYSH